MYCQRNYGQLLGYGPDSIAADGCYLSSFADLETWADHPVDPASLNALFKAHGIYVQSELLPDAALASAFPGQWQAEVKHCESFPCPQGWLNNDDPDVYVIVELSGGYLGSGTHFSPIYSWKDWTIADTWTGTVRPISVWGAPAQQLIQKVVRYTYVGANRHGAAAPTPTPLTPPAVIAPVATASFQGIVGPRGAKVRAFPGQDQTIIPQPPPGDPSIVNPGIALAFDGWCHHVSRGQLDPVPLDQWTNRLDDRWYRTQGAGHWLASADVAYHGGDDPPANLQVTDPAPVPCPVPGTVPTAVLAFGDPMPSYREPAAEWRGPLPGQNYDPDRREPADAAQKADPNAVNTGEPYDLTRGGFIVLHHMAGAWQGADQRFRDASQQASAHYGVRQDGTLIQWVDEKDASYGAGVWEVNLRAINIEVEDLGRDTYTTPQLQTLVKLLAGISKRYAISLIRGNATAGAWGVLGHSEVPYPTQCPGRLLDLVPDLLDEAQTILNAPGPVPAPRPNPVPTPAPKPSSQPAQNAQKGFWELLVEALLHLFVQRQ